MDNIRVRSGNRLLPWLMLSVSLAGFSLFYLFPFAASFFYTVLDAPVRGAFCGLQNYRELFQNQYFLRGLKNTATFMALSIPLNIVLSLGLACMLHHRRRYPKYISLIFLMPLAIPSAASAFFWESFFGLHGTWNRLLHMFGMGGADWFESKYGMLIMVIIFTWKNAGYQMILFLAGLSGIPKQYYEYADMEGAGYVCKFRHITCVYLAPTMFLVLIMTFVNSFQVFKEIYIITGGYPPDGLYVLQHYMNNMFLSLNYPKLAGAAYILTAAIVLIVTCMLWAQGKLSKRLYDR